MARVIRAQSTVSVVSQYLCFDGDFLQATVCFPPAPTEILWMTAVIEVPSSVATFRVIIEQPTKAHTAIKFAWVSWWNIGPAAARPAGPAFTAWLYCIISMKMFRKQVSNKLTCYLIAWTTNQD